MTNPPNTTPDGDEVELRKLLTVAFGQLMIRSEKYPNVGELVDKAMPIISAHTEAKLAEENESFKSIFEDAATWVPQCYNHERPSSYCHACKKRKWFALLAKEIMPIIDERISRIAQPPKEGS